MNKLTKIEIEELQAQLSYYVGKRNQAIDQQAAAEKALALYERKITSIEMILDEDRGEYKNFLS